MLSAEVYSFRMQSRLAISLSWIAGYTNVIVLMCSGMVVSHATGNVTHFARSVAGILRRSPEEAQWAIYFAFLVGAFFAGAVTSAFMTELARRAGVQSKYILPMSAEAALLCYVGLGLWMHPGNLFAYTSFSYYSVTGVASFAMGLQNATITKISGAVIRTTHLTGVVTDIGLEGVQFLLWYRDRTRGRGTMNVRARRLIKVSRRHPSILRIALLASILGSFLFGATAGGVVFLKWGPISMIAPVAFLLFIVFQDFYRPIADVREIDPSKDEDLPGLDELKALMPPGMGIYRLSHHRAGRSHHAPDFARWLQRLPRHWRVVILTISPLTHFDVESAMSLLTAVGQMQAQGRRLIFSGMNRAQYKLLMSTDLSDKVDVEDFCPDLEFAIARGMNLLER